MRTIWNSILLSILLACSSCGSDSSDISESVSPLSLPSPIATSELDELRRFAEKYEPMSGREVIPSPPELDSRLLTIIERASRAEEREHEKYIVLIFLKVSRFHRENFKLGYELGRENPLTIEFYRIIGEKSYAKAERMGSDLAERYVEKNPKLFGYPPIAAEMKRIEAAEQKVVKENV